MDNMHSASGDGYLQNFDVVPSDIAAGRHLRAEFAKFWSQSFEDMRAKYNEFVSLTPAVDGVSIKETNDPAPGWWIEPKNPEANRTIFFIHGGGYGLGSAKAYTNFLSHLATLTSLRVFALEYPLAPEATLPKALEMAVAAIKRLQENSKVAIVGDSAGGGMSLAATARLVRDHATPAAVAVFSPWTDLTLSGDSARSMAIGDVSLDPDYLRASARQYVGARSTDNIDASPLFGIPAAMPPTLIQVGTDEILLDDSKRYADATARIGNSVRLEVYQGMHHVFVLNLSTLSAARSAVERAAQFLKESLLQ